MLLTKGPLMSNLPNSYMAVQVVILLLQDRWGPRFFVPRLFLPDQYNYERPPPPRPDNQRHECVVRGNSLAFPNLSQLCSCLALDLHEPGRYKCAQIYGNTMQSCVRVLVSFGTNDKD